MMAEELEARADQLEATNPPDGGDHSLQSN
jgi:hypothetical protein